jgi:molecular chaperone GrpE
LPLTDRALPRKFEKRVEMTEKQTREEGHQGPEASQESELNQEVDGVDEITKADADKVALERELAEQRDKYLRLFADFENFKKRALKEQSELLKYQGERIVIDLLEVVDNLELALSHSSGDSEALRTGLEMVHKQFIEKLGRWEIRGESGMGAQFDPQKHAAISRVPGKEAGVIVGELKKPYFYKDKMIRCGEVVVAVGSDEAQA